MQCKYENPTINIFGTKRWFNKLGQCHRDGDKPACEYADGSKSWWKNGELHRENDLPACEWNNGDKEWCLNGACYRWDKWITW